MTASAVVALGLLASLSCRSKPNKSHPLAPVPDQKIATPVQSDDGLLVAQADAPDGLNFRISEGKGQAARAVVRKPANATKISAADTNALLARLPAVASQGGDRKSFALRSKSQPPPRTGDTIKDKFPGAAGGPPPSSTNNSKRALKVVRHAPEGEVPLAPHLSITFNQPMIAVTSHAETIAAGVPVKLTPQPAGKWRWVGTKTLLFDPDVRFPAATQYSVEVPAGTKSTSGQPLAKAHRFTFGTPAPRLLGQHPTSGPQELDPIMFARFDQKISKKAVLDKILVKAGGRRYRVREATETEIQESEIVSRLIASAEKAEQSERYVAFRVGQDLPKATSVSVTIEKGTPSAEGPRTTKSGQSFSFETYGPLRVKRSDCSWGRNCPPGTPWYVMMTNPLDVDAFEAADFRVSPTLSRFIPSASGRQIGIDNSSKGRTTYTVTLPPTLKDKFGQTLGKETKVYFKVGKAEPALFGGRGLVVLDPAAKKPSFDVFTTNVRSLDVEVYKVTPKDWDQFLKLMQRNPRKPVKPPGKRVVKTKLKPRVETDALIETSIDLSKALNSGLGHAIVIVKPTTWPNRWKPELVAWTQSTRIGLDAFIDNGELVGWASDLLSGGSLSGVDLEIVPYGVKAKSGANGIRRMELAAKPNGKRANLLLARRGADTAFLPEHTYAWSSHGGWSKKTQKSALSWFTFDDRTMYRPGEKVSVKGWIRSFDHSEGGDIGPVRGTLSSLRYKLVGPRGNDLAKGTTKVSPLGGFDLQLKLPKTPNLGSARIEMEAIGRFSDASPKYNHYFQIQEFRRPEYEVKATASEGPHIVGKGADITASAKYYAGGGLAGADVRWQVRSVPGQFSPPNQKDFTFGRWVPWWQYRSPDYGLFKNESFAGKTDGSGKHNIRLDFLSSKPPRPMSVTAEAYVTDVNRQQWAAKAQMLVHPSELYVGLKRARYFVEKGKPIEVEAIVVNHDGSEIAGRSAQVTAVRLDWKYKNGKWTEEETEKQTCAMTSQKAAQKCSFNTPLGGTYRVVARVADDRGRPNESEVMVWVSGGKSPPKRNVEMEALTLIPNKKDYKPGDTAEILVQSPFYPAEGLMTTRRLGILDTVRFKMTGPTTKVRVSLKEAHVPNLQVKFDVVGSAARLDDAGNEDPKLPRRPAFASGQLMLMVPPVNRTLKVDVKPAASKLEPGATTWVNVAVRDSRGRPVPGVELATVVVDESVLALSSKKTPDPVATFYANRYPGARDYHSRSYVKLARPEATSMTEAKPKDARKREVPVKSAAPAAEPVEAEKDGDFDDRSAVVGGVLGGEGFGGGGNAAQPIAIRKNFDALATFAPKVLTDKGGMARVKVKMPDNLTRYRVMVIAAAGDRQFGAGESSITARKALMVRPSPPRFLNFGDKFEFPVVLQNQTSEAMNVTVAMRTTNARLTDGAGRRLSIPAGDRVEVRFPAAAELPGIARFQIGTTSGSSSDATELFAPGMDSGDHRGVRDLW